jgi:hypothetical protein
MGFFARAMMKSALSALIIRSAFSACGVPRVSESRFDCLLIKPGHSSDRKFFTLIGLPLFFVAFAHRHRAEIF